MLVFFLVVYALIGFGAFITVKDQEGYAPAFLVGLMWPAAIGVILIEYEQK